MGVQDTPHVSRSPHVTPALLRVIRVMMSPTSQMSKLRLREAGSLTQGHTAPRLPCLLDGEGGATPGGGDPAGLLSEQRVQMPARCVSADVCEQLGAARWADGGRRLGAAGKGRGGMSVPWGLDPQSKPEAAQGLRRGSTGGPRPSKPPLSPTSGVLCST